MQLLRSRGPEEPHAIPRCPGPVQQAGWQSTYVGFVRSEIGDRDSHDRASSRETGENSNFGNPAFYQIPHTLKCRESGVLYSAPIQILRRRTVLINTSTREVTRNETAFVLYRDRRIDAASFAARRGELRAKHGVAAISVADPDNPGKSRVSRLD